MSTAIKPVLVRAWIYCSQESYDLLAEVGTRWLDCMASHQANIVNEAEQLAQFAQRRSPVTYAKHRARWNVASSPDAARLRSLIASWPELTYRQQEAFVEQIKTVVGR